MKLYKCTVCKKSITLEEGGVKYEGEHYHDGCIVESTRDSDGRRTFYWVNSERNKGYLPIKASEND